MNLILRELRAHLKALLIWCGVIIFFTFVWLSEFGAYYDNPEMAEILEVVPEAMLKAFSMNAANLTTVNGFVSLIMIYINIALGIFAALLGSGIIAKEERDKTVEFLMALPVSRRRIITAKLAAGALNCLGVLTITIVTLIIGTLPYTPPSEFYSYIVLQFSATFLLQAVFLVLGMLCAAVLKRHKRAGAVSVYLVVVTYFLSVVVELSDNVEFLKYFTPFKYFEPLYLINEAALNSANLCITLGIMAVSLAGIYLRYPRRDLQI